MSTDLKKYAVQSARYDGESPNRSFRSFRGSKDFNDKLKDAWWEGGNGFGLTHFGWHLRLRLDHILYSNELELVDVKVIDTDISDHKPLMARFRLNETKYIHLHKWPYRFRVFRQVQYKLDSRNRHYEI